VADFVGWVGASPGCLPAHDREINFIVLPAEPSPEVLDRAVFAYRDRRPLFRSSGAAPQGALDMGVLPDYYPATKIDPTAAV
jgi:hypothetical protein